MPTKDMDQPTYPCSLTPRYPVGSQRPNASSGRQTVHMCRIVFSGHTSDFVTLTAPQFNYYLYTVPWQDQTDYFNTVRLKSQSALSS